MPLVSVVMTTYNHAEFLPTAIASIFKQHFADFELIIINDGSSDTTQELLSCYKDPRLKIYHNLSNQGAPAAANQGISLAQGKLIARMDSDDIALPERLGKQVAFLEAHPNVGVLGTERYILKPNQKVYTAYTPVRQPHSLIAWRVMLGQPFCHPTLMLRRDVLDAVGGYDETMVYGDEDADLYVRLLGKTVFRNLPEPLLVYRQHANSLTAQHQNKRHLTQHTRHNLASRLVGYDFTRDMYDDIAAAWYRSATVSTQRAAIAARFLLDLYSAMRHAGYFLENEITIVQDELIQHLYTLHNPQHILSDWRAIMRLLLPKSLRAALRQWSLGKPLHTVVGDA